MKTLIQILIFYLAIIATIIACNVRNMESHQEYKQKMMGR